MKTICIRIDEDLFYNFKLKTINSGKTLQNYMHDLIEKDLYPTTYEEMIDILVETNECLKQALSQVENTVEKLKSELADINETDESESENSAMQMM